MTKRFPTKLFVKIEEDGKIQYPVASAQLLELAEMGKTIKVGVYQLIETTFAETIVKTSGTIKK